MVIFARNLLLIFLYIVASYGAWELAIPPYYASVFWPAAGIALGFVYLHGARVLPGVFIGTILSVFLSPLGHDTNMSGVLVALSIASGASLQAFAGSFFIKKLIGENTQFQTLRSIVVFNAVGVLSALIACSLALIVFYMTKRIDGAGALAFWQSWFIGDALGIFIFAPLIVIALSKAKTSRQRYMVIIVPTLILFLAVIMLFFNIKSRDLEVRQKGFESNVQLAQKEIFAKFDFYLSDINALQSFYEASSYVNRDEFSKFSAYALEQHSGIHALAWSPYILDENKQAFLDEARNEYGADYNILGITQNGLSSDHNADIYMPVYYIEPYEKVNAVLGTDVWSNDARQRALKNAFDNNVPSATEALFLVSEEGKKAPGFVLVAPVYNSNDINSAGAFKGAVMGAFQYRSGVMGVMETWKKRGVEVIMGAAQGDGMTIVYQSQSDINEDAFIDGFFVEVPYVFAGQNWFFRFYMNPDFYNQNINYTIWYALIAGLVFLAFTCAFLMALSGQAASMQDKIDDKTAELSQRNKFLNLIMDTVPDMIFVKDSDLNIVQANKTFFERYAPEDRDKLLGTSGLEQFPEEEREGYLVNDRKTLEFGFDESQESNTDYLGVVRTLLTRKERFYDENNQPFLLGHARDVTDILSVQRKLETILDTTADGLITMQEDGIIETYNKACEAIFGYTAEEAIGKNISLLIPEYQEKNNGAFWLEFNHSNEQDTLKKRRELQAQRKDGHVFPIDISIAEVELGSRKIFSGVIRDVTEKKKAEELGQQITQIFNSAIIEFYIFDAQTFEFLFVNNGAINNMGYSAKELLGHRPSEFVEGYASPEFKEMAAQLMRGEKDRIEFDMQHERKDGSYYDVVANLQLTTFDGRPAFIASMLDITERNKVTEELKRSNKELESFAYVTSHDLKAPLRHISMSASFFKEKFEDTLDDKSKKLLNVMIDGAARMQNMIESLLGYSRVGRDVYKFKQTDMNNILQEVKQNLADDIVQSDAVIEGDNLPEVRVDRFLIIQLLQNLIQNAIKYRKEDEAPHIRISYEDREDSVCFYVADNGIGIDSSYSEKIFQIFQRLHRDDEYEGVGIGLSICQRIVEFHGGEIHLDENYTDGTQIVFTLPKK